MNYYEIWKLLSEAGRNYGDNIISEYLKNNALQHENRYLLYWLFLWCKTIKK